MPKYKINMVVFQNNRKSAVKKREIIYLERQDFFHEKQVQSYCTAYVRNNINY